MPIAEQWERYTHRRIIKAGELIFKEGMPGEEMCIVKSGLVVATRAIPGDEPLVLGYRGPGELIGEMSLITDTPRSASITAAEDTEILTISREDFWHLMRTDEAFQQTVMDTLITNILASDESRIKAAIGERELVERFASLSTEHERMAELIQLRSETIHFIVHDLRNPIHLILASLDLFQMQVKLDSDSDAARMLAMSFGGARRLLTLVDSLLDVERLEDGELSLEKEQADLAPLLQEVIDQQKPMASVTDVTLSLILPEEGLPPVMIDKMRIQRLVSNLIDNALKFTPHQGAVTLRVERDGAYLVISINDTGKGIPADQRERVFERFVQTEEGRKASGFGLGLSFCRSAIAAHGGTIRAEAGENDIGTKFIFTLPVES